MDSDQCSGASSYTVGSVVGDVGDTNMDIDGLHTSRDPLNLFSLSARELCTVSVSAVTEGTSSVIGSDNVPNENMVDSRVYDHPFTVSDYASLNFSEVPVSFIPSTVSVLPPLIPLQVVSGTCVEVVGQNAVPFQQLVDCPVQYSDGTRFLCASGVRSVVATTLPSVDPGSVHLMPSAVTVPAYTAGVSALTFAATTESMVAAVQTFTSALVTHEKVTQISDAVTIPCSEKPAGNNISLVTASLTPRQMAIRNNLRLRNRTGIVSTKHSKYSSASPLDPSSVFSAPVIDGSLASTSSAACNISPFSYEDTVLKCYSETTLGRLDSPSSKKQGLN